MATILDSTDEEQFCHCRKFCWTVFICLEIGEIPRTDTKKSEHLLDGEMKMQIQKGVDSYMPVMKVY